jgi:hypothetical protein
MQNLHSYSASGNRPHERRYDWSVELTYRVGQLIQPHLRRDHVPNSTMAPVVERSSNFPRTERLNDSQQRTDQSDNIRRTDPKRALDIIEQRVLRRRRQCRRRSVVSQSYVASRPPARASF